MAQESQALDPRAREPGERAVRLARDRPIRTPRASASDLRGFLGAADGHRLLGDGSPLEVRMMPQRAWNRKRERQYEHVKEGLEQRGRPEDVAEEIAARTVNKERARTGEARQASRTSTQDISPGRRGGMRSHRGPGGRTRDQLYEEAKRKNIKGRSKMTKRELERAVGR